MIDVMVTMRVNDEPLTLFGKIDETQNTFVLNYQIYTKAVDDIDLIYHRSTDIPFLDTDANRYSAYGCKFTQQSKFISAATVQVEGMFTRLLKEQNIGALYNSVRFSFEGIECFFPMERFLTQSEAEDALLSFTKEKSKVYECTLLDSILCKVESTFDGVKSSSKMYDLCVKQSKSIALYFPDKHTVDDLLAYVVRVKQYFEFILGQEIGLSDIIYFNQENPGIERAEVIYEPLVRPKTILKPVKENPYRESYENLFDGLNGWLGGYDYYRRVIEIWQKTIYNLSVSEDDLFIWRCQAFELLCTLNTDILQEATSHKAPNQQYPNLKNFLTAIKSLYGIVKLQPAYYQDVKAVRDVLTHNNPKKSVSANQKNNSYSILKLSLCRTMSQVFGIKGIPTSLCLGPYGK